MSILAGLSAAKLLPKVKAFFTSKWFWAAIFLIGVIGGVTYTLNNWKDDAVETAVESSAAQSTIDSHEAKDAVEDRSDPIDRKAQRRREQSSKDYANARSKLEAAPEAQRNAQAPALIIDTLNELDRLRAGRDAADEIPDAPVR